MGNTQGALAMDCNKTHERTAAGSGLGGGRVILPPSEGASVKTINAHFRPRRNLIFRPTELLFKKTAIN